MLEQRRDQQSADAAVAVQEGVERLELHVHQRHAHEGRQRRRRVVDVALQIGQQPGQVVRRRGHKHRAARPCAAHPVLRTPQFPRLLAGAPGAVEQQAVRVAQQPHRDGQPRDAAQVVAHQPEGTQVVGDFFDVGGVGEHLPGFVVEQVGQRGLGAFDLRREQRLLAQGAVEQPINRRDQAGHPGQPGQRHLGPVVSRVVALRGQGRAGRRQRMGHEGAHHLAERGGGDIGAGGAHRVKAGFGSRLAC